MDKSGEFRLARILRLAGILLLARGHVKKNPGPINVRLSYQLLHLEKVRPGASTIVSVAHEMFALASVYCRIGVHPQKLSISIYETYLSSFRNFALGGIDE